MTKLTGKRGRSSEAVMEGNLARNACLARVSKLTFGNRQLG